MFSKRRTARIWVSSSPSEWLLYLRKRVQSPLALHWVVASHRTLLRWATKKTKLNKRKNTGRSRIPMNKIARVGAVAPQQLCFTSRFVSLHFDYRSKIIIDIMLPLIIFAKLSLSIDDNCRSMINEISLGYVIHRISLYLTLSTHFFPHSSPQILRFLFFGRRRWVSLMQTVAHAAGNPRQTTVKLKNVSPREKSSKQRK